MKADVGKKRSRLVSTLVLNRGSGLIAKPWVDDVRSLPGVGRPHIRTAGAVRFTISESFLLNEPLPRFRLLYIRTQR